MDSYELSKIGGAACAALLLIVGTRTLIEMRLAHHGAEPSAKHAPEAAKPAAGGEAAKADATGGAAAPAAPAAKAEAAPPAAAAPAASGFDAAKTVALIGAASAEAGKATFVKCAACHTAEKGAPNKLGPNLWGIVDRAKGSVGDFQGYSADMKAKGGTWTFADLAQFVYSPKSLVPKTKMVFPGMKDPQAIAELLAYVRTLADTPASLPK